MPFKAASNWRTTLAAPLAAAAGTVTLAAGAAAALVAQTGALGPGPADNRARLTLARRSGGVETAWEIVDAIGRAGDQLTLETDGGRAKEGSTNLDWAAGENISARLTREMYSSAAMVISKEFVDAPRVIDTGATMNIEHLLGELPKILDFSLQCQVADSGYSPGQVIQIQPKHDFFPVSPSMPRPPGGFSAMITITHIIVRFSAPFFGYISPGGAEAGLTLANWRLITKAYA